MANIRAAKSGEAAQVGHAFGHHDHRRRKASQAAPSPQEKADAPKTQVSQQGC